MTAINTSTAMALHGYNLLSEQRISAAIEQNKHRTRLHLVPPLCPVEVWPIDFGHGQRLIERATESTRHWLDRNEPKAGVSRNIGDFHTVATEPG